MVLLRSTALFVLVVSGFHYLTCFIKISENHDPNIGFYSFPINCSYYNPTIKLLSVQPPTNFFNPPNIKQRKGSLYIIEMTLSSSARLDALEVNHYELQLQYTCGKYENLLLPVHVVRDPGRVQCVGRFASPAGEIIQVPETVTPGARLYTLLLPGLEFQKAKITITNAQDPPFFSIDGSNSLWAPSQGLKGQAEKVFPLKISVTYGMNGSCHGMLVVKVLPVPSSHLSFLKQNRSIMIREDVEPGSEVVQVQAQGSDVRYEILSPVPCPLFSIGYADGVVRTTAPLELAQAPSTMVTRLQVKAFERLQPWASVELNITVKVQLINRWPPRCLPAQLLTQIPENVPVGMVLSTFTCTDPDSSNSTLDYQLLLHGPPGSTSLCLWDRTLKVNDTLDCDAPGGCLQHAASILVLDRGQPQMSTVVPVLVMVTPVNEFSPTCVPRSLRVPEDIRPPTVLGSVEGTDMDYPHDSIEYYISGGSPIFVVDRLSGKVHLLRPLDYEVQRLYRLTVLLVDYGQDQHPDHHRTGSCTITIEVEDVNEHAPECEPPFQELTIHIPPGRSVEVTKVSCWIPQEPQRLTFSYSIVRGNNQNQFSLQGAILVYKGLTLQPSWPEKPHTYELLVRVADEGPSTLHLSTTATITVHLVPWRPSTIATTTVSSLMTPLVVRVTEAFWQPEPWFVVVLTVTSALLLLALGWLLQRLFQVLQAPNKPDQALLLNRIQGTEGSTEGLMEAPKMEMSQAPQKVTSLHFDGRAQDARTGRVYNTSTGARRWL
ncbi:cadherin-related family member 4 [Sorex araneus]|uniref:cadherin-related family member 4 n=1 Tax=Sorex araneus TaxID=42254 RepID=UPI00243352E2|nr:cadherin-related family member 4 [Sorex araneus]